VTLRRYRSTAAHQPTDPPLSEATLMEIALGIDSVFALSDDD
jgi:hypothetical protein